MSVASASANPAFACCWEIVSSRTASSPSTRQGRVEHGSRLRPGAGSRRVAQRLDLEPARWRIRARGARCPRARAPAPGSWSRPRRRGTPCRPRPRRSSPRLVDDLPGGVVSARGARPASNDHVEPARDPSSWPCATTTGRPSAAQNVLDVGADVRRRRKVHALVQHPLARPRAMSRSSRWVARSSSAVGSITSGADGVRVGVGPQGHPERGRRRRGQRSGGRPPRVRSSTAADQASTPSPSATTTPSGTKSAARPGRSVCGCGRVVTAGFEDDRPSRRRRAVPGAGRRWVRRGHCRSAIDATYRVLGGRSASDWYRPANAQRCGSQR